MPHVVVSLKKIARKHFRVCRHERTKNFNVSSVGGGQMLPSHYAHERYC